ncbi:tripartite tricarboxylate transporter substrate binding protein [Reyranella sp. CPCC 100927]|uniref:Bug family tripartite tricarboxylate transporter substrate binding protein n=1 Tax=Reyranella sp. CPCC 100927 TaxID=2599616 RepID=UPI0011B6ADB8|nr:tripartite tricarboxylate transporter substrate binding protein [Reyranella sp. CPCC 100927]TWT15329.1 tripartite tricarboxylate transporter substrate binding protein [Reyranella sp. CPCC 100927]
MTRFTRLSRRTVMAGAAALPALAAPAVVRADAWRPKQAVRIVVPAAPGGTTDIVARLLASHLQQRWGQSVVVDNKSGAGGVVGSTEVVRAAPDGLTMLMGNIGPQSIAYSLYRNLPYKPESLIPVSNVITAPNVLVVHPAVPAKTVPEFVTWLRGRNGEASYASSGTGQSPHLSGALFLQLVGAKATHVPYRGAAPALNDLVAGVTQYFFDNLTTAIEFVRAGKLNALGLTSAQRNPLVPDLPPIRETMPELKDFDVSTWFGVFLPAGTPKDVVDALNGEIKNFLEQDATKDRFKTMAGFPAYGTPAQFNDFVQQQIVRWRGVIEKEGLKLDVN